MTQLVINFFQKFAHETGILGDIRQYGALGMQCLVVLAVVFLLFGLKAHRAVFSVLVFIAVALASCFLLTGKVSWGSIVTSFSVLGSVLAFLAYKWVHLGACVIASLVAGAAAWVLGDSLWWVAAACAVALVLTVLFPVIGICVFTALWGSFVLVEGTPLPNAIWLIVLLTAVGFAFQMLTNQKQRLFAKKYPARVTHWLGQRKQRKAKGAKVHANSIP